MINNSKVLAIIPARSGSKGLPGKNIKLLMGKPLLSWSIDAAVTSQYIDEIHVSTDDEEIAGVALASGPYVQFMRPVDLATDEASSVDVITFVLGEYEERFNKVFDVVVLLEPTSPMRSKNDIDHMLEKLCNGDAYDGIISIGEVGLHPQWMKKVVGNKVIPYIDSADIKKNFQRQKLDKAYFPYGVAYIVRAKSLIQEKTFYVKKLTHHVIKPHQCYEIDDIYDFWCVEKISAERKGVLS
jgi:CMP-N,N'-diacetyllegionaminic acid synthase